MWLMHYITRNSLSAPGAAKGEWSADGGESGVAASGQHKNLELCLPYGVLSLPPVGMLRSKGGASLVLKNDGRVLINGREVGNG